MADGNLAESINGKHTEAALQGISMTKSKSERSKQAHLEKAARRVSALSDEIRAHPKAATAAQRRKALDSAIRDIADRAFGTGFKEALEAAAKIHPNAGFRRTNEVYFRALTETLRDRAARTPWGNGTSARIQTARNSVLDAIRQLEKVLATTDEKSPLGLYLTETLRDRLAPAADCLAPDPDCDCPIYALTRAA